MLVAPALNWIMFAVFNWLGSSRLPKIFRSRGYLLGTSQVTHLVWCLRLPTPCSLPRFAVQLDKNARSERPSIM